MKKVIFLALLLVSANLFANELGKDKKLRELVNIMDMDSMVEQMYSQMEIMMQNMSTELGVTPEEQPLFDEYFSQTTLIMREEMSWKKMEPEILTIYNKHFSEKEIDDMLGFYRTETGQSILKKMPDVMRESMMISQSFVQSVLPKMQKAALQFRADIENARSEKNDDSK